MFLAFFFLLFQGLYALGDSILPDGKQPGQITVNQTAVDEAKMEASLTFTVFTLGLIIFIGLSVKKYCFTAP